jgi:hypothetical protein
MLPIPRRVMKHLVYCTACKRHLQNVLMEKEVNLMSVPKR